MKADSSSGVELNFPIKQPSISACLIVRNEAHCLAACLESIQGFVSEIVIVDTGSTDETVTIAGRYTDKIFHHEWHDHFAQARNVGLSHATGDWILVLDADEVIPVETAKLIPDYLMQPEFQRRPLILNWHIRSLGTSSLFKRGLFPNGLGIEFAGRVHETAVLPGQEIASYHCPELIVHHIRSERETDTKQRYYQRLLHQSLTEQSDLARINHIQKHLGLNQLELEEWLSAWNTLVSCYQGMHRLGVRPQDGFYGEVLRGLVRAGTQLDYSEVCRYARELQEHFPSEPVPKRLFPDNSKTSALRKVLLAGSLTALAACQAAPTSPLSQVISPRVSSSVSSPESPEALRARYGPFTRIGIDYPEFKNYLSQTHPELASASSPLLAVPDFSVKGYDFSQCSGTYGGFTYNSIGSIRDARLQCDDSITYSNFGAVEQCYARGGVPVWIAHQICTPQASPDGGFCFTTTEQAELLECNGVSPTPTSTPLPNPTSSSSLPPGSSPDWSLSLDTEWFSPNGDGVKDIVNINVNAIYPWTVNIKKSNQILKQYSGQSSQLIYWNGYEANKQEGKYNVILVPPRFQTLEKDKRVVGIDLTPPTVDFTAVKRLDGKVDLKVVIQDPGPFNSGIDDSSIKIEESSSNITIISGKDQPVKDKDNKVVYNLLIDQNLFAAAPNNFQITNLAYQTLALNNPPGGLYNGDYISVSVSDLAGNSYAKDSPTFASGGRTMCTDNNGNSVPLNTVDRTWYSIAEQSGNIVCHECASDEESVPDVGGGRVCQKIPPCKKSGFVVSGHDCVPALGGGGLPSPNPNYGPSILKGGPCRTRAGYYTLNGVYDFDKYGPDVSILFTPNYTKGFVSINDTAFLSSVNRGSIYDKNNRNIPHAHGGDIMNRGKPINSTDPLVQTWYNSALHEKGNRSINMMNTAYELMVSKDEASYEIMLSGANPGPSDIQTYKGLPSSEKLINTLSAQRTNVPLNFLSHPISKRDQKMPGHYAFVVSINTDAEVPNSDGGGVNSVVGSIPEGGHAVIEVNLLGEPIYFTLTKKTVSTGNIEWSAACY